MTKRVQALVVHYNSQTLETLQGALERQGMQIMHAGSRVQAKRMLSGLTPVPLVFTEAQLPDGTWADVLAAADKAALPVNVIVVARVVDTRFYVETIEAGAFDFIAAPFAATELTHVVRSALDNVNARRSAVRPRLQGPDEVALAEVAQDASAVLV
jgi:DNA-binding NtrC family response regulator